MLRFMDKESVAVEDIGDAVRQHRALKKAPLYRIALLDAQLAQRPILLRNANPTGQEALVAAGVTSVEEANVFAILPSGDFEDIRLSEAYDLYGREVEQLIFFVTDRIYRFMINDAQLAWGQSEITGRTLRQLAALIYGEVTLYQDQPAMVERRRVGDADVIDLSQGGVERFVTSHVA